jgi:ABC-type Fe3+ transport system permease subunit
MRSIFRALAFVFLIAALAAAIYEVLLYFGSDEYRSYPLGQLWFDLDPGSLNLVQAVTERYIAQWLWDPVIFTLLQWPAWSVFGGIGVILLFLTRSRGRRWFW